MSDVKPPVREARYRLGWRRGHAYLYERMYLGPERLRGHCLGSDGTGPWRADDVAAAASRASRDVTPLVCFGEEARDQVPAKFPSPLRPGLCHGRVHAAGAEDSDTPWSSVRSRAILVGWRLT